MTTVAEAKALRRASLAHGGFALIVFILVLAASGALLFLDFRQLQLQNAGNPFDEDQTGPVTLSRPRTGDQVRPYLPSARPMAPDRELPGIPDRYQPSESTPLAFERDGPDLRATGRIVAGSADELARQLDLPPTDEELPEIKFFILHSPGGNVSEAMEMARLVRKAELTTKVQADGYCGSACPLVFAGGQDRLAHSEAWIGVHRVYAAPGAFGTLNDGIAQAQGLAASIQDLLVELGVDPRIWTHAMRTPKEQLYFLTEDELIDLKLATAIDDD